MLENGSWQDHSTYKIRVVEISPLCASPFLLSQRFRQILPSLSISPRNALQLGENIQEPLLHYIQLVQPHQGERRLGDGKSHNLAPRWTFPQLLHARIPRLEHGLDILRDSRGVEMDGDECQAGTARGQK